MLNKKETKIMNSKCRILLLALFTGLLMSCATGQYMQMKSAEQAEVLTTVQSSFVITGSFRYRSAINMQAYISLLAEAQKKYPDTNIDIRDISWAIGKQLDVPNNYEYVTTGKVIKLSN
jgi:hypothetical protein